MKIKHLFLASTIAAATLLGPLDAAPTSAAIMCQVNPVIPTPATQIMPLIYRQLPLDIVDVLRGSQPIDRGDAGMSTPSATPVAGSDAVVTAAQNVLRCGTSEDGFAFVANSTPQLRAFRIGIGDPKEGTAYLDDESINRVQVGTPVQISDGRWVVDFAAILDDDDYIAGEMAFVEKDGAFYLDESYLTAEADLDGKTVDIDLNEKSTREVKMYDVVEGDRVVWSNSSTSMVEITVTDADGNTIFTGHVLGDGMVGAENQNVLPIVGLNPGDYTVTTSFTDSGVVYTATIMVGE